jgi:hypothetical protein
MGLEITAWSTVLLDKLIVTKLPKEISAFYGTRRFITMFTRALTVLTAPSSGR